jgi:hypothetical protein
MTVSANFSPLLRSVGTSSHLATIAACRLGDPYRLIVVA